MREFDKIIGYKDVKNELIRLCDVLKNKEKYNALGVTLAAVCLSTAIPALVKRLWRTVSSKKAVEKLLYAARINRMANLSMNLKRYSTRRRKTRHRSFFSTIWTNLQTKTIGTETPKNTLLYRRVSTKSKIKMYLCLLRPTERIICPTLCFAQVGSIRRSL